MTTIVTDGKTIAADGQSVRGDIVSSLNVQKIFKRGNCLYAFAGSLPLRDAVIDWIMAGANPEQMPQARDAKETDFAVWEINGDGVLFEYSDFAPYATQRELPAAIGTGCEIALGALAAGKSPREAVEIACELDVFSGGEVISVPIPVFEVTVEWGVGG